MKGYSKLLRFLKGHIQIFPLAFFCIFVSTLLEGVQFSLLIPIVDRILNDGQIIPPGRVPSILSALILKINEAPRMGLLWTIIISVGVLLVVKHFFLFFKGYLMNDISQRVMRDIRLRIYEKIQSEFPNTPYAESAALMQQSL